ncbi:MAG: hypothetical protein ACE5HT_13480, partial [Gemmatimonadales bacterium]
MSKAVPYKRVAVGNASQVEFDRRRAGESPRPSILVVDDDDSVRSAVANILHGAGYDVVTETDGNSAL